MGGEVYGAELAADWTPLKWWRLRAAYTFLEMQLHTSSGSSESSQVTPEGQSPHHQVSLRSLIDLPWHFELDAWLRCVDELPALGVGSYVTLYVRLGWKPVKSLELSIVGQNLLDSRHPEFALEVIDPTVRTEVERAIYGKITWGF
jgi:iron complex outermembrane receptor protein